MDPIIESFIVNTFITNLNEGFNYTLFRRFFYTTSILFRYLIWGPQSEHQELIFVLRATGLVASSGSNYGPRHNIKYTVWLKTAVSETWSSLEPELVVSIQWIITPTCHYSMPLLVHAITSRAV